ncbi:MAG: glycoside hydrolase family 30 protein [candidate division KSB1 bacterium]|nr:glycoside hydrolase family 30 protein [candidate division KSB1 bacterium]
MKSFYFIPVFAVILTACSSSDHHNYTQVQVIQTSRQGDQLNETARLDLSAGSVSDAVEIRLDPAQTFQTLEGFGGSFTEASAHVLKQLSADKRDEVIRAYFSDQGSNYTLTRTHMNSCDFSLGSYSYAPVAGDTALEHFSVQEDKDDIIPLIKDAMAVSRDGFKLISSPWTAPPWMKTNEDWFGGSLKPEYYETWALFFARYIRAYQQEGIPVWAVTVENEPLGNDSNWESMHYTPEEMRDFIKYHLGPQFSNDNIDTRIMIFDQNRDHVQEWADVILSDSAAYGYTWGIAVHWYRSTVDWFPEALNAAHEQFPQKPLLNTEACIDAEIPVWRDDAWYWQKNATDWGFEYASEENKHLHPRYVPAFRYARDIIGGLNSHLVGWVDWNLILNDQGGPNHVQNWCIAPVIARPESNQVYYTPLYYVLAHFSRYMRPDARRISAQCSHDDLMVTACINPDQRMAVQVFNPSESPVPFQVTLGDKRVSHEIPAAALQTLLIH